MILPNSHRSRGLAVCNAAVPMFNKDSEVAIWGKTASYLGSMGMNLQESSDEEHDGDGEVHCSRRNEADK